MDCQTKVTPISPPMILGEGPQWLPESQSLVFVDYSGGTLSRLYPHTGRHQVYDIGGGHYKGPCQIIPVEGFDNKFIVGHGHDLVCVDWSPEDPDFLKKRPKTVLRFDGHSPKNSLNDAKCDPKGRLWIGTTGHDDTPGILCQRKGTFYKIDHDLSMSEMIKQVTMSNGLAWSHDATTFFYVDTLNFTVDAFDYDDEQGRISNRRVVFDFQAANLHNQAPDGMTIDNDGNLWVACYGGWKVICINPYLGKVVNRVDIPCPYVTSCCFGGPDYSTLFVTTATFSMNDGELRECPDAGKTFAVTGLGVKGSPHVPFKVNKLIFENILNSE